MRTIEEYVKQINALKVDFPDVREFSTSWGASVHLEPEAFRELMSGREVSAKHVNESIMYEITVSDVRFFAFESVESSGPDRWKITI